MKFLSGKDVSTETGGRNIIMFSVCLSLPVSVCLSGRFESHNRSTGGS